MTGSPWYRVSAGAAMLSSVTDIPSPFIAVSVPATPVHATETNGMPPAGS